MIILLTVILFLCGSLMFSYWLGLTVKKDLKTVGDGNPGGFNLWQAAGYKIGLIGILLDFMKGFLPLFFVIRWEIVSGTSLVPVALAAILGHVFSPFVKFKGGKGIAVTFGVWSAVSGFEVSIAYAIILAILKIISKVSNKDSTVSSDLDGFMSVSGMMILGIYLFFIAHPTEYIYLWLGNLIILTYTNRLKLVSFFKTITTRL